MQLVRDLGAGTFLEVTEAHDGAVGRRQPVDGREQDAHELAPVEGVGRVLTMRTGQQVAWQAMLTFRKMVTPS